MYCTSAKRTKKTLKLPIQCMLQLNFGDVHSVFTLFDETQQYRYLFGFNVYTDLKFVATGGRVNEF